MPGQSVEFKVEAEDKLCDRGRLEAGHHLKYAASVMGLFTHPLLYNRKWPVMRSEVSTLGRDADIPIP